MVNWFGNGEDYCLDLYKNTVPSIVVVDSRWDALIPKMKFWGFNSLRCSFGMPNGLNYPHTPLDLDMLEHVIAKMYANEIRVILDSHSHTVGTFGSATWHDTWLAIVDRFKNDPRILAWELQNEPGPSSSDPSIVTPEQCVSTYIDLLNEIRATGDTHPIVLQMGVSFPSPTWTDANYDAKPVETRPSIVISEHFWTYGNPTVAQATAQMTSRFNKLRGYRAKGFDTWNGECGIHEEAVGGGTIDVEKASELYIVNQSLLENCGFNIWLYGYYSIWQPSHDEVLSASNYARRRFIFSHWQDGDTSPIKQVIV